MRPHLIETLRVEADGRMPLLPWHIERLGASSTALGYRWSIDAPQRAIARAAAPLAEGVTHRLRVRVADDGVIDIETQVLPALPVTPRVMVASTVLDSGEPLLRHKTTHRPWYASAAAWISTHPDHFDLLYFNERDELCEGSRCNVYLLRDGQWWTPPLACGVLPGAQRAALLDDEAAAERVLTRSDLAQADGIRLSNALRGWFDVTLLPGVAG